MIRDGWILCLLYHKSLHLFRYGFVEFDDPRDADDAVCDLNGKDLCGKRVIVEHTIGQRRDGGTGSRSGRSKRLIYSLFHNTIYQKLLMCHRNIFFFG
uniref:RRM domain-containing protein n=1 Tax=Sinocyclocheilus rhinocerous TaxID=307959 RepID=A0A673GDW1_9TELE